MKRKRRANVKKRVSIFLAVAVLFGAMGAGIYLFTKKGDEQPQQTSSQVVKKAQNPLTGEEIPNDQKDKKPVAIMVENSKQALPQWGLSSADIVYETVVEGGITRNVALFYNVDNVKKTGPVRSVREYYPPIATPFNSLFVHYGGSETGYDAVKRCKLDEIDGLKQPAAFAQDQSRVSRGKEHSYYTSAELVSKVAQENKVNMKQSAKSAFEFSKDAYKETGTATGVKFAFSSYCPASFSYDASTKKYNKSEFGSPQTDANTNAQIGVDNVFLLYANVTTQQDGVHKSVDFSGGGSGVYLNDGKYTDIKWVKKDDKDNIETKDKDGNTLKVNSGKSWICMIPNEMQSSTSLMDAKAATSQAQ